MGPDPGPGALGIMGPGTLGLSSLGSSIIWKTWIFKKNGRGALYGVPGNSGIRKWKTGQQIRACSEIRKNHDIWKSGASEKFAGAQKFRKIMISGKTGHPKNSTCWPRKLGLRNLTRKTLTPRTWPENLGLESLTSKRQLRFSISMQGMRRIPICTGILDNFHSRQHKGRYIALSVSNHTVTSSMSWSKQAISPECMIAMALWKIPLWTWDPLDFLVCVLAIPHEETTLWWILEPSDPLCSSRDLRCSWGSIYDLDRRHDLWVYVSRNDETSHDPEDPCRGRR